MDTLVFDIETQNFFTDPDVGWDNFEALKISVVGVYSYARGEYLCFEENELEKALPLFAEASHLIGFSSKRYDVPVLNLYFKRIGGKQAPDLWKKTHVDLLESVERGAGRRISLSRLAEANLGIKKDRHGSEAIGLYARGEIDTLKEYCLKDVAITKDLYELSKKQGYLIVPDRVTGVNYKIGFENAHESASVS